MTCRPCPERRARGSATVEFVIVAFAVLIPLVFGTVEIALLGVARHTLGLATFMAARAGATAHGDRGAMQRSLARGLAPLYAARGDAQAYARSLADVLRPDRTRIEIWNPVATSFADFGVPDDDDGERIPNVWRRSDTRVGAASRQTIAEANQLGVRIGICRALSLPITAPLIVAGLRLTDTSPFAQGCYAAGRVPLYSRALVHMHSDPQRAALGL